VEISVSDNGNGIRPDFLPLVFERFRQAEPSSPKRSGGLGLGLAIVKQLTELHGGRAIVESRGEGEGATFTIALPVRALRLEAAGPDAIDRTTPLDSVTVLLVEDDHDNRDVLRTLLEQHHAVVTAVGSGKEALEMLPNVRPDVLLSDIGLPDLDGYELIRRIRELEPATGGRLPAIALTAHASSEDRTKALRAGYQAHLTKPVEPSELVATIVSLTGLTTRRREANV
jgi:CheY-like chemotaxis protein